ncbi:ACT domain-containing protein [Saccharibacillus sp. CPCC 101409]|uniref:ACT domain-containing protein n=1 Tax=Saccharibacillus sp. CPCC 101409 TaxID=3058041 RepID=UPI002673AC79|nr:ACT domain-containing protein [Saccharibacillus sp. CPCC 101409]MDO3410171.1 ACT domain-containing protein [Saccharibacillus sp. CPCC 101409]
MKERYYLAREDILPEAILKTLHVKELLAGGQAKTVNEAVNIAGISRSAFYKYKDGIHQVNQLDRERLVTLSLLLEHKAGILSKVLGLIAESGGNVLTINQSIPLQGSANVVLSVETSRLHEDLGQMTAALEELTGVSRVVVIGQG